MIGGIKSPTMFKDGKVGGLKALGIISLQCPFMVQVRFTREARRAEYKMIFYIQFCELGGSLFFSTFFLSGIRLRGFAPAAPVAPVAPTDFLVPQVSSDPSSKFDVSSHAVNSFSAFRHPPT